MEPHIIDYYNDTPHIVNVIDKMNDELTALQTKYDILFKSCNPTKSIDNMIRSAARSHNDMAKLLYHLYGEYNVCTSLKKNEWYYYDIDMKKWRFSDQGIELRIKLSNEIHNIFLKKGDFYIKQEYNLTDNGDDMDWDYGLNYLKTAFDLKNPNFKQKIMKECSEVFYKKDFLENNSESIEDLSEYYNHDHYGEFYKIVKDK
tara:strand:- start:98 stop:703 length:606 start_codon:yes stop_codon:yes gene_type:complete